MTSPDKQRITSSRRKAIIGNTNSSFWLYDSIDGFDLTHPLTPESKTVDKAVTIQTTTMPIQIDPVKSALVIVDMQNFFLSPALGRPPESKGLEAQKQLLQFAIPAARKAGMRIVWLNWGLTDQDLRTMPPAGFKLFGFQTLEADDYPAFLRVMSARQKDKTGLQIPPPSQLGFEHDISNTNPRIYRGLGNDMGNVTLMDSSVVEAGRLLMRDQWNTSLTPQLQTAYQEGLRENPPDIWINKNRMSGFWGASTPCTEFLEREGIKTLLFAGVNTDQCVGGSLNDAHMKGYDCILLTDGAAMNSPQGCQETIEYNVASFGFCTSCKDLWDGVATM